VQKARAETEIDTQSQMDKITRAVSALVDDTQRRQNAAVSAPLMDPSAASGRVVSSSTNDGVDYSEYGNLKAGEVHTIFESTLGRLPSGRRVTPTLRLSFAAGKSYCDNITCQREFSTN
jgi:hypothetical protein